MSLPIAFSPCPNDTFSFCAWVNKRIEGAPAITPVLGDIQHLNEWALQRRYPVSKVSVHCLGHLLDDYLLLPVGAALGHNCGPKIISRDKLTIDDIAGKRIAIPGKDTTAHLLFDLLCPAGATKHFCTYDEISPLLQQGTVDCGLIIHETRFTFEREGLHEVADLGQLWEETYHLPLPLGCLVAKRSLGAELIDDITKTLQRSILMAREDPALAQNYVIEHSIEKDLNVVRDHIRLYVNEESIMLSEAGQASIAKLLELARAKGLTPESDRDWLFESSLSVTPA